MVTIFTVTHSEVNLRAEKRFYNNQTIFEVKV
jgi:hypothetical protein